MKREDAVRAFAMFDSFRSRSMAQTVAEGAPYARAMAEATAAALTEIGVESEIRTKGRRRLYEVWIVVTSKDRDRILVDEDVELIRRRVKVPLVEFMRAAAGWGVEATREDAEKDE